MYMLKEELIKEVGGLNIPGKVLCAFVSGSHLYGTNHKDSDIDIRGVFIPNKEYLIGMKNIEQVERKDPDIVMYSLEKFFKLALKSNPNIVEFFFVPPSEMFITSDIWQSIVASANLFLSKKARYTFAGYAFAQLKKIKSHRMWSLYPPHHKPTRAEHDTLEQYKDALSKWKSYQNWNKNRNPARKKLEEAYGYDTKHAMHLVRLILEGEELLTKAKITLPSPNAKLLRRIREGCWDYESLIENIGNIDAKFDEFYEQSVLPHKPSHKTVDTLYQDIIKSVIVGKDGQVFFGGFMKALASKCSEPIKSEYMDVSVLEERSKIFDKFSKEARIDMVSALYAEIIPIITKRNNELLEAINKINTFIEESLAGDFSDKSYCEVFEIVESIRNILYGVLKR